MTLAVGSFIGNAFGDALPVPLNSSRGDGDPQEEFRRALIYPIARVVDGNFATYIILKEILSVFRTTVSITL